MKFGLTVAVSLLATGMIAPATAVAQDCDAAWAGFFDAWGTHSGPIDDAQAAVDLRDTLVACGAVAAPELPKIVNAGSITAPDAAACGGAGIGVIGISIAQSSVSRDPVILQFPATGSASTPPAQMAASNGAMSWQSTLGVATIWLAGVPIPLTGGFTNVVCSTHTAETCFLTVFCAITKTHLFCSAFGNGRFIHLPSPSAPDITGFARVAAVAC